MIFAGLCPNHLEVLSIRIKMIIEKKLLQCLSCGVLSHRLFGGTFIMVCSSWCRSDVYCTAGFWLNYFGLD